MIPPNITELPPLSWRPEIVALDLDGTCLDGKKDLHPRIIGAVARASRNVPVVIATGRMFISAQPWARRLGLDTPLICYQGALVCAQDGDKQGAVIAELPLRADLAIAAIELCRERGYHRQAYVNEQLLCEEDRPEAHLYTSVADVNIRFVDDLAAAVSGGTTKIVCVMGDPTDAQSCQDELTLLLGQSARVTRSLPEFVEVTDPGATKSAALRRLCEHLSVNPRHSVAVGDAPNDADMIAAAGLGVAVATAPPEVLSLAGAVCPGPGDAGVAVVLEMLGLV